MRQDTLTRILCNEYNVRAYTAHTLGIAQEITDVHGTTPQASIHFTRAINAAVLMSSSLKPGSRQNLSLKISGSGPMKEIHVQIDAWGNVRGYIAVPVIDPLDTEGDYSFGRLIGEGFITVIKDLGLRDPYRGTTPIQDFEIAADVARYLTFSEQVPSALILTAKLDRDFKLIASGGILIQVFPDTDPEVIASLEKKITSCSTSLGDHLANGNDILAFLSEIFDKRPLIISHSTPLHHNCRCSRDMLRKIVSGFAEEELIDMKEKDDGAEMECGFCRKKYRFSGEELIAILKEKRGDGKNSAPA